jgi:hypothetical protein
MWGLRSKLEQQFTTVMKGTHAQIRGLGTVVESIIFWKRMRGFNHRA